MKNHSTLEIDKIVLAETREAGNGASASTHSAPALRNGYRLPLLAFVSSLVIVLAVSRTPQSLFADPSWQLKALQQHLAGASPSLNTLVEPDPRDMSKDVGEWISWWPIGTNVLVYPLMRLGLTIAASIRVLAALALIVGSIGFGFWLRVFHLPQWLAIALAISIPWIRYANVSLFQYAAEGLVFAVCPWLLIGAFRLRTRWMQGHAEKLWFLVGFGCLLGFAYWLKYSAVFISAGVLVHLAIASWKQRGRGWRDLTLVSGTFISVVAILNVLNHAMGAAMNAVTEHPSFVLEWRLPFNFVGLMAMAMADADGLARYVLFHPGRSLLPFNYLTLCYLGLPGGLILFWLLMRRHSDPAMRLSRDLLATVSVLFLAIMTVFSARAMEARYISAIGIAVIPAALQAASSIAPKLSRMGRVILWIAALCYLALPIAYGAVSVLGKIHRTPANYQSGPSGLYNPLFANADAKSAVARVKADFNVSGDVWYLTEAFTAMDLPGRAILRHADFLPADALKQRFRTTKAIRVHVLLPPWFEENGKGAIIRAEFVDAVNWSSKTIPGMNYVEWTAVVRASE
jgi:hypothetical protein